MSGICGIVRLDNKPVKKKDIQKMLNAMNNRGNDAETIFLDSNIGFGHKMLWTTPESLHEKQPLMNNDASLILTADARVDNRDELIQKLNIDKSKFNIITDADLILFAYEKWGEECPEHIIGDFSFAIWDKNRHKLFCARDRLGLRPFNYLLCDDFLIFSSEIEPLFTYEKIIKKTDIERIREYIFYWAIDRHDTFYEHVKRLPPAQKMNIQDSTLIMKRYWFPETIKVNETMSIEKAIEGFHFHFREAVKSCMRSAYPIAFEVSGGIDSSSVFAVGSTIETEQPVLSYHIHYKGLSCDESEFIDLLAKKFKTTFLKIDTSQIDYKEKYNLDFLYDHLRDWPANGTYIEHLYKHEVLEKNDVRVVLTGIGGDEVMSCACGYLQEYAKEGAWRKVFKELKCMPISWPRKTKIIISMMAPVIVKKLFRKIIKKRIVDEENILKYTDKPLEKLSELTDDRVRFSIDYKRKNIEELLSNGAAYWADMNPTQLSGKNNIEFRHPYYDNRLIEYVLSIPPEYKSRCGVYKNISKEAMRNILPGKLIDRTDIPLQSESLLKQINMMDLIKYIQSNLYNKDCIIKKEDIDILIKSYDSHNLNEVDLMYLWTILNLKKWKEKNEKDVRQTTV